MQMVAEKGRGRGKNLWSSVSDVPAKLGPGELDFGQVGSRGLLPPGSQDLATWQGDGWTHGSALSEPTSVWSLLFANHHYHVPVVFSWKRSFQGNVEIW